MNMDCKFLKHGMAISYDHVVKPCCVWQASPEWKTQQHISKIDLSTWHQSREIMLTDRLLQQGTWPTACRTCEQHEASGREDSMRHNGIRAYENLKDGDITLEIRPGSVCNFACQTCWPEASSRVAQFYAKAGLIDIKNVDSQAMEDFDFLLPIKHRIKQVVLLGGEPFYDKSCLRFLAWAHENLHSRLTMFTNGSHIDFQFVQNYGSALCIVVSLDAVGRPAEYIRFGTDWQNVYENYMALKKFTHVELRVNITLSIYNYFYLPDLIDLLCDQWPACVTFGQPKQSWLNESAVPTQFRESVITRLLGCTHRLADSDIEVGQKTNAINAVQSVIDNLAIRKPYQASDFDTFKNFVRQMDAVKNLDVKNYCSFLWHMLEQPTS